MEMENYLVKKAYHEKKFLQEDSKDHPIRELGELYLAEQKKDMADLSYIRFAQGEVYFLNCDFEAAIFKWENIHNELEPWAKKNIADAYLELGFLSTSEEIYKAINTDSLVLNTEVALQLFTLYVEQGKDENADHMIKNAVALNPDYPNVTRLACMFFEKHEDWSSAVELAINEAARTNSTGWFKKILQYITDEHTKSLGPNYFVPVLNVLKKVDLPLFEQMLLALWHVHKHQEEYLEWLKEASRILLDTDQSSSYRWKELPQTMNETFIQLVSGRYHLSELEGVMPALLSAWLNIAGTSASAAILAWNDIFPEKISQSDVDSARELLTKEVNEQNLMEQSVALFHSIKQWAHGHKLTFQPRLDWMVQKLTDIDTHHVMVAGNSASEKSAFVHLLLQQSDNDLLGGALPALFENGEEAELRLISNQGILPVTSSTVVAEAENRRDTLLECSLPNDLLRGSRISLIDYPELHAMQSKNEHFLDHVRISDSMLFALNTIEPFSAEECEFLLDIREQIPSYPIHFVLKVNEYADREEMDEIRKRIRNYFPDAELITYSSDASEIQQLAAFSDFAKGHLTNRRNTCLRTENMLFFIKELLKYLLQQQVKVEAELAESIDFDENLLSRIQGAIHQMYDVEEEKTNVMQSAYRSLKDEIKADLLNTIPTLIKKSADILQENSDFGNIHHALNDEMNKRIDEYLQYTVHPTYINSLQDWITFAEGELNGAQEQLIEWSDGFNTLMENDQIRLECDFQVLADWQRDADRMTGSIQIDKENILLKRTPSQVLLKSAGKIFGVIPANNTMMYNRYKNFIENEDYTETAESIAEKFFRQFELLEKAIPRDISLFFREPFKVLKQSADTIQERVDKNKSVLNEMKSHPETFRDPVKLFDVRLRQIEWMDSKSEKYVY